MSFPSDEQLNEKVIERVDDVRAVKWTDLETLEWYNIVSKREMKTQFGNRLVLALSDRKGNEYEVWAPAMLVNRLKENPKANFVQPKGPKRSKQNPTRQYHDFSLACF